jgi:hypothetical protein
VDDSGSYGDWIADVERPAAQFRGRYQLRLDEARKLVASGGNAGDDAGGNAGDNAGEAPERPDPDPLPSADDQQT